MQSHIEQRSIISPASGAIRLTRRILESDYVRCGNFKLTHEDSEWQLSEDDKFNNIVLFGKSEKVLKAWTPDTSKFVKKRLYVRVRYGANGIWSEWSKPVVFTTK
jgi:hypothetical protein